MTPCKNCDPQNVPKLFLISFIIWGAPVKLEWSKGKKLLKLILICGTSLWQAKWRWGAKHSPDILLSYWIDPWWNLDKLNFHENLEKITSKITLSWKKNEVKWNRILDPIAEIWNSMLVLAMSVSEFQTDSICWVEKRFQNVGVIQAFEVKWI